MHQRPLFAAAIAVACLFAAPIASAAAPKRVVDAIIQVESGGNPKAKGRAGEIGLMQIKCATARSVGFKGKCASLYNSAINRKFGAAYLRLAIRRAGGDIDTAISLYQRGVYAKFRGCSAYCKKVKRAMR